MDESTLHQLQANKDDEVAEDDTMEAAATAMLIYVGAEESHLARA